MSNLRGMRLPDPDLQPGTNDADPYFDLPSGEFVSMTDGTQRSYTPPPPPETVMVWCVECQSHWRARATEDYWKARAELCPKHSQKEVK